jgi:hypothetical protein
VTTAPRVRRRRTTTQANAVADSLRSPGADGAATTSAVDIASRIKSLIAANRKLTAQNARLSREVEVLTSGLAKIERTLNQSGVPAPSTTTAAGPTPASRVKKRAAAKPARRASVDSPTLAKRRASLARAREALAAKRAAARAA